MSQLLPASNEQSWQADETVVECPSCKAKFGLMTRRHHCRACGLVYCSKCTSSTRDLVDEAGKTLPAQRVCAPCAAKDVTADGKPAPLRTPTEGADEQQKKVLKPFLDLMAAPGWSAPQLIQTCQYEDMAVPFCTTKAVRMTTTMSCSIQTFARVVVDAAMTRRYDPTLADMRVVEDKGTVATVYTSYQQASRFITARDFAFDVTHARLTGKDVGGDIPADAEVFVSSTVHNASVPAANGFVRGTLHVYGYIAVAESPNRIKVTCIAAVDPNGSIPKSLVDAAAGENCKKVAKIRELSEELFLAQPLSDWAAFATANAAPVSLVIPVAPLRAFPAAPTEAQKRVLKPLLDLSKDGAWGPARDVNGCSLSEATVSFSATKALKMTTTFNCSIQTFARVISDTNQTRRFDPTLVAIRQVGAPLDAEGFVTTGYTSYQQPSRFITARDFAFDSTNSRVSGEAVGNATASDVFVQSTVHNASVPAEAGFVRGTLHVYGYVAVAEAADRTTVTCVCVVDPNGSIPKALVDAAAGENCKKVIKIKEICEEQFAREADAAWPTDEEAK
jgi:hypothetical protein